MANLTTMQTSIGEAGASLNEFISDNRNTLITTGAVLSGVALGVGGVAIISKVRNSKKRKTSRSRKQSGRARDRKFISKQKHERRYAKKHPKRRKTGKYYKRRSSGSKRGVKYTKNGQPYIILKSGKARFVKKK